MTRSPKESFIASPWKEGMSKIAMTEEFIRACDYALLCLQQDMRATTEFKLPTDPYVAIDANSQMQGALRVIEILKHIAEPEEKPKVSTPPTIYHS